jgi:hypothetical protein
MGTILAGALSLGYPQKDDELEKRAGTVAPST